MRKCGKRKWKNLGKHDLIIVAEERESGEEREREKAEKNYKRIKIPSPVAEKGELLTEKK